MTSKEKKDKIKEYAKSLFLEVNENGERVYSYRQIVAKIKQKYNKSLSDVTVRRWGIENNWDLLLQTAKNIGIEKALKEKEDIELSIKDAKSNEIAEIYKKEDQKYNLATDIVLEILKSVKESIMETKEKKAEMEAMAFLATMKDLANVANQCFGNLQKLNGNNQNDELEELKRMFDAIT